MKMMMGDGERCRRVSVKQEIPRFTLQKTSSVSLTQNWKTASSSSAWDISIRDNCLATDINSLGFTLHKSFWDWWCSFSHRIAKEHFIPFLKICWAFISSVESARHISWLLWSIMHWYPKLMLSPTFWKEEKKCLKILYCKFNLSLCSQNWDIVLTPVLKILQLKCQKGSWTDIPWISKRDQHEIGFQTWDLSHCTRPFLGTET